MPTPVPAQQPAVVNEVPEIAEGQEMVEIAEEPETPVAPEPVAVDPNRPLRRKK